MKIVLAVLPWLAPLTTYALIGWGTWKLYPDAWPLVVGCLLWLDLFLYNRR